MSEETRQLRRFKVEVRDPETGDTREFAWLPAYTESGADHAGRVQFLGTPFYDHPMQQPRYERLEVAVSEIPQG